MHTALAAVCIAILSLGFSGCDNSTTPEGHESGPEGSESGGESGSEGSGGEPGEGGVQFARDETATDVRQGVELTVNFDAARGVFTYALKNTTTATVSQVRVEIHLSNGCEIGPTPNVDLAAGETKTAELDPREESEPECQQDFTTFSIHVELGPAGSETGEGGHGEGGEGGGGEPGEGGVQFAKDETATDVRQGVELTVNFDAARGVFPYALENTTTATVTQVRVEIHLSNGCELGPTPNVDLAAGETKTGELDPRDEPEPECQQDFATFSIHVELGSGTS